MRVSPISQIITGLIRRLPPIDVHLELSPCPILSNLERFLLTDISGCLRLFFQFVKRYCVVEWVKIVIFGWRVTVEYVLVVLLGLLLDYRVIFDWICLDHLVSLGGVVFAGLFELAFVVGFVFLVYLLLDYGSTDLALRDLCWWLFGESELLRAWGMLNCQPSLGRILFNFFTSWRRYLFRDVC